MSFWQGIERPTRPASTPYTNEQLKAAFFALLEDTQESYSSLLTFSSKISEENSCFVQITGAQHEERVWDNAVYDCLQYFFGGV